MTETERLLWSRIRRKQLLGYQFYRQRPVGDYIVDFYCPAANLIIEIDGSQHHTEEGKQKDMVRDENLSALGFRVVRFTNSEIKEEIEEILDGIYEILQEKGVRSNG